MERIGPPVSILAFSCFYLYLDLARPEWLGASPTMYTVLAAIDAEIAACFISYLAVFVWLGYVCWKMAHRKLLQLPADVLSAIDCGEPASFANRFGCFAMLTSAAVLVVPALRCIF
jgi:hypothetical protein